jgi:hypothetical protein
MITIKEIRPRNNKRGLLFPQKDIFLFFNIKGIINTLGTLLKKIISIKGKSFKNFTITAINAKQIEARIIIKIPTLGLSSRFSFEINPLILLILIAPLFKNL